MQRHGQDWYCCACVGGWRCGRAHLVASGAPPAVTGPASRAVTGARTVTSATRWPFSPGSSPGWIRRSRRRGRRCRPAGVRPSGQLRAWPGRGVHPALLTGDGAQAPAAAVLRLIDELCAAGPGRSPGRPVRTAAASSACTAACRDSGAAATASPRPGPCPAAAAARPANRPPGTPTASRCARSAWSVPGQPGRVRPLRTTAPRQHALGGGPVCASCIPRKIASCSVCGRTVPCMVSKATAAVVPRVRPLEAECSRCGKLAAVRGAPPGAVVRRVRHPDQGFWKACTACGTSGRLLAGICRRCQLAASSASSSRPGGQVRPELRVLHDTLAGAGGPPPR